MALNVRPSVRPPIGDPGNVPGQKFLAKFLRWLSPKGGRPPVGRSAPATPPLAVRCMLRMAAPRLLRSSLKALLPPPPLETRKCPKDLVASAASNCKVNKMEIFDISFYFKP